MKTLITLFAILLSIPFANSQDNSLDTKSVTLDNFISFIADEFSILTEEEKNKAKNDKTILLGHSITLLLETSNKNLSSEDKIILQHSLKFLAKRLTEDDRISIVVYGGQNGLLLDNTPVTDIKKSLFAIGNIKKNILEKCDDGITKGYALAKNNFDNSKNNSVVMLRNPNVMANTSYKEEEQVEEALTKAKTTKSKGNNVVLLTAMTLLPELISIIKD